MKRLISTGQHAKRLHTLLMGADAPSRLSSTPPLPPFVVESVARWRRLQGVPFHYLVPDARQLPLESIRFFVVDDTWIETLIAGALSVGNHTRADHVAARGLAARLTQVTNANPRHQVVSGFLLHSRLVSDWPDLEATAIDADGQTLHAQGPPHRLAAQVIAATFDGQIAHLDLHEPTTALHLAIAPAQAQAYERDNSPGVLRMAAWAHAEPQDRSAADFAARHVAARTTVRFHSTPRPD